MANLFDNDSERWLPPIWAMNATNPPDRPPALIDGVVRQGHVALISGKAKVGKSFFAIGLCVAVACGLDEYAGLRIRRRGRCLYLDPELDSRSLEHRFRAVAEALGADTEQVDKGVMYWALRGVADADLEAVVHDLELAPWRFDLVVIDSASCFIAGDENCAGDVREFFADVLAIAELTGATVLIVHHHAKGYSGDRQAADRARGSSVWADAPDAVLTLTETAPPSGDPSDVLEPWERALVLESGGIREFGTFEPRRLIFSYPVHLADADGRTEGWKPVSSAQAAGRSSGRTSTEKARSRALSVELAVLAELLATGAEGLAGKDCAAIASEALGETVKTATVKGYLESASTVAVEQVSPQRWRAVPRRPPQPALEL